MGGRGGSSSGGGDTSDPKNQAGSSSDSLRKKIDEAESEEEKEQIITDWIEENESPNTETTINPITGLEYECYSVTIDGIKIYYESPDDSAFAAIKSLISGNKIPDLLKEGIEAIMIIPDQNPGNPTTIAKEENGIITIFENRIVDAGIIGHEAAHTLADDRWGNATPPAGSDYRSAIDSREPPVSTYGRTSPSEDFAEAIRMYITNRTAFKKGWPKRYKVIHRMMRERGYRG